MVIQNETEPTAFAPFKVIMHLHYQAPIATKATADINSVQPIY